MFLPIVPLVIILVYWRFNNYVALYELQELKDCEKPQNKHHKKPLKNVTHGFILNGKELPIHYSTIADVFRDVFCDVYLRSFKVLHFRRGHVVIEVPIKDVVQIQPSSNWCL